MCVILQYENSVPRSASLGIFKKTGMSMSEECGHECITRMPLLQEYFQEDEYE